MNLTYDIQTVSNPVDDVPPLDLTTCGKIYLEFTMLSIPILTFLSKIIIIYLISFDYYLFSSFNIIIIYNAYDISYVLLYIFCGLR